MADTPTNGELLLMIQSMEKARVLQATEYERRLAGLNNEYARAKDVLNTYVTRELFDAYTKDQAARSEALSLAVTLAAGEKQGVRITKANLMQAVGTLVAFMSVATAIIIAVLTH